MLQFQDKLSQTNTNTPAESAEKAQNSQESKSEKNDSCEALLQKLFKIQTEGVSRPVLSSKKASGIMAELRAIKESSVSVYAFVSKIFELLETMANLRLDPLLASISRSTMELIEEHRKLCGGENLDYNSDEEDPELAKIEGFEDGGDGKEVDERYLSPRKGGCGPIGSDSGSGGLCESEDSDEGDKVSGGSEDQEGGKRRTGDFMDDRKTQKMAFKKKMEDFLCSDLGGKSDQEDTQNDSSDDYCSSTYGYSADGGSSGSEYSRIKEELSIIEERTEGSSDGGPNSPRPEPSFVKKHSSKFIYNSKINFDRLGGGSKTSTMLKDFSEEHFLRIKHLQTNYIVHYIDKTNTDFRLSLECLKRTKTLALDVITQESSSFPAYIQVSSRKRCYVFNMFKLKKNEEFKDFLIEVLKSSKVLKIVFQKSRFLKQIRDVVGRFPIKKSLILSSMFSLKEAMSTCGEASALDLPTCCLRLFGKKPDHIFNGWVPSVEDLGFDEIHSVALNALAVYMIYLKLKTSLRANIECEEAFSYLKSDEFISDSIEFVLDCSCPPDAEITLELLGYPYSVEKACSYKNLIQSVKGNKSVVLVTCDKYLIIHPEIKHCLAYFSKHQLRRDIEKKLMNQIKSGKKERI